MNIFSRIFSHIVLRDARCRYHYLLFHSAIISFAKGVFTTPVIATPSLSDDVSKNILYIDEMIPDPMLGAGYPRAYKLVSTLAESGYQVTIFPLFSQTNSKAILADYERNGISVIHPEVEVRGSTINIFPFLKKYTSKYNTIIISRPGTMLALSRFIRHLAPRAHLIYDAEALFVMRKINQRELSGKPFSASIKNKLILNEVSLARNADAVMTVSENEKQYFSKNGIKNVFVISHNVKALPTSASFSDRKAILFVGSIHDSSSPNEDALLYYIREIHDLVYKRVSAPLVFAGINKSKILAQYASENVIFKGPVDDLSQYYNSSRIFIAPTRFSAGIPLKILEAAAYGIPVVSTPLLADQLGWKNEMQLLVGDNPMAFAEQCVRLYSDCALWNTIRSGALEGIRRGFNEELFRTHLLAAITFNLRVN